MHSLAPPHARLYTKDTFTLSQTKKNIYSAHESIATCIDASAGLHIILASEANQIYPISPNISDLGIHAA
jgi:hypothetical protein